MRGTAEQNGRGTVPGLSAFVMAYHDAHQLRACLESVAWADELVVKEHVLQCLSSI